MNATAARPSRKANVSSNHTEIPIANDERMTKPKARNPQVVGDVQDQAHRPPPRTRRRIGGWSHSRHRFYAALLEWCREALWFIAPMRQLYRLEDALRDSSPGEQPGAGSPQRRQSGGP